MLAAFTCAGGVGNGEFSLPCWLMFDQLSLIKDHRISMNMTSDMVLLSWGTPNKITWSGGHTVWHYGPETRAYLRNNRVVGFY
ncbi:hypothetical protein GGQ84_002813 [Desulfitispora alkaliphila]|uniref:hypothetical protein n=1 Tax=Desulfitispora alkaliphila TaxID=622674 RepID=UPI003D1EABBA